MKKLFFPVAEVAWDFVEGPDCRDAFSVKRPFWQVY